MLKAVQIIAVVCAGLLAGIYLGYREGAFYALKEISASSFVQFQRVVHIHYAKFMPPLSIVALLSALAWLVTLRSRWNSLEFWLMGAATCGLVLVIAMTRTVNVPLNNQLMTWSIDSPPSNFREIWAPWDRVNTIRSIVSTGVLALEALALCLRSASR